MKVEIWSDVACPWCFVGKRRFDVALSRFEHGDAVEVRWRSFELDPSAPEVREAAYVDHLAAKYRVNRAEAEDMIDRMIEAGARNGVVLRFDKARPGNTFDVHRLLHLGAERGVQPALKERLFHAVFTKGASTADLDALVALAEASALDPAEARAVLESDRYAAEVRADEQRAADLGITFVPFFVFAGRLGVAGAESPELLLEVLEQAWAELEAAQSS
ncbi:MAG TPA: DsbA family oxidoreductase [Acidimicrobiales bacterium]|nr:DsbA family oxidoreductase [Acidimicrobiales bacterium]